MKGNHHRRWFPFIAGLLLGACFPRLQKLADDFEAGIGVNWTGPLTDDYHQVGSPV